QERTAPERYVVPPTDIPRVAGRDLEPGESRKIFGKDLFTVSALRSGDALARNHLDPRSTSPDPVRVLKVENRFSDRASVHYREENGGRHEVQLKSETELPVMARRHGALSVSELSYLVAADQGAVRLNIKGLEPEHQNLYVTGQNNKTGEFFHGTLQGAFPENQYISVQDADGQTRAQHLSQGARVTLCESSIPLEQLPWKATSEQTAEPQGHHAEPSRIGSSDERVKKMDQAEPGYTVTTTAVTPTRAGVTATVSKVEEYDINGRPPMPPQSPGTSSPGIGR
ncbi:hypothetical protein ACTXJU_18575, partial [Glutamicibacter ardleyensis]